MSTAPRWIGDTQVVEFTTDVEGTPTICWISEEALSDHFGSRGRDDAVRALMANMARIAPVAIRVARATPPGELIIIRTKDF